MGTARHSERRGNSPVCLRVVLPLLGPRRAGAGAAGQAPARGDPATPTAKERWSEINSNPHTWCTAMVWGATTCWGRKDPSPPCSVGDSRCSEKLRGRRWCPAWGLWDGPARRPVLLAARQVPLSCYCLAFLFFFLFPLAILPPPHSVFFFPKLPAEFYQQMFSKACLGPQSRVQKCQRAERSWGVRLSEQLQKQVPVLGHLRSWHGFRSPTGQSAKLFCVHASELPSWDIVRGGFVGIGP